MDGEAFDVVGFYQHRPSDTNFMANQIKTASYASQPIKRNISSNVTSAAKELDKATGNKIKPALDKIYMRK